MAVLASIEKATVSLPLPLVLDVMVSQEALLVAVQEQPVVVVTFVLPVLAVAVGLNEVGATENVQGAPAWVTVNVWPAMVSVPVLGEVDVFAAIEKATVPFPEPLAPDVMVSQEALLVAVQAQPAVVVTVALLEPALAAGFSEVGVTENAQTPAPAWVTVTVCPAMVNVPVRGDVTVLAAMEKATVPLPFPLAPDVIVSQASLLVAVQAQPLGDVTVALLEPAVAAGFRDVGDTEKVHGAAAWLTVTVCPAIVNVPVRGDVVVLAAIEKPTEPFPLPLAPDVMVNQDSLSVAVQLQPAVVVTFTLAVLAVAAGFSEVGATENTHGAAAWVTVTVCPAIVSVAVRVDVIVLAAIEMSTTPLPEPLAPDVIVNQDELSVAVQLQPAVVVTFTLAVLAVAAGFSEVGEAENVQGAAACVTVTV